MSHSSVVLANLSNRISFPELPKSVVEKACLLVLDHLACSLLGMQMVQFDPILDIALQIGGIEESTLFGRKRRMPALLAAYCNSQASMFLDYDDTYDGHPGSTVIPVALALGERFGSSGQDVIEAIVCGYEIGIRIANAIKPTPQQQRAARGLCTWQTFCSAATAAKLMKLGTDPFAMALSHVPLHTPVPSVYGWGFEGGKVQWLKNNYGWGCMGGILSAELASKGFFANQAILDGPTGFSSMAGSDRFDKEALEDSSTWFIEEVHLKPYSSCRHIQGTLDAVSNLQRKTKWRIDELESIEIETFWTVVDSFGGMPSSEFDIPFSAPMCVSLLLHGIPTGLQWFKRSHLNDESICSTARKVTLIEWKEATDLFSRVQREFWSKVRFRSISGQVVEEFVAIPLGDPRNPMSIDSVKAKFKETVPFIGDFNAEAIIRMVLEDLSEQVSITSLMKYLS